MPDDASGAGPHATSLARKWWAYILGLVVFLVSISLCSILVFYMLGIPFYMPGITPAETYQFDLSRPLQPLPEEKRLGPIPISLLAWAASGFVSAMFAGLAADLIGPDLSLETFRDNLIAGLVVLVGGFWIISLATHGFDGAVLLHNVFILFGGIYGIRTIVRWV